MLISIADLLNGEPKLLEFDFPAKIKLHSDIIDMQDLKVIGTMVRKKGVITFSGKAFAAYRVYCARCLEITQSEISFEFDYVFIKNSEVDINNKFLDNEQDFFVYDGGFIDLSDAINSDIIINLPFKVVCSDDCKGLCRVCGANLNVSQCDCDLSFGNVFSNVAHLFAEEKE